MISKNWEKDISKRKEWRKGTSAQAIYETAKAYVDGATKEQIIEAVKGKIITDNIEGRVNKVLYVASRRGLLTKEDNGKYYPVSIIDKTLHDISSGITNPEKMKEKIMRINEEYNKYLGKGLIEFVTFHPSYSYEDFIEGITVEIESGDEPSDALKYKLRPGIFKNICKRALASAGEIDLAKEDGKEKTWREVFEEYLKDKDGIKLNDGPRYVLIIDEINRGDMAKIFGELITLLEADKRLGEENELTTTLPASGDTFGVPPNIYIIATMNTADRSIALLDVALRRRFGFIEMNPDFEVLMAEHINTNEKDLKDNGVYELLVKSKMALEKVNEDICGDPSIGRDKQIGHSFLFKVLSVSDLLLVWKHEILPLLEEYCYNDYNKINKILFGKYSDTKWISSVKGVIDIVGKDELSEMLSAIINKS